MGFSWHPGPSRAQKDPRPAPGCSLSPSLAPRRGPAYRAAVKESQGSRPSSPGCRDLLLPLYLRLGRSERPERGARRVDGVPLLLKWWGLASQDHGTGSRSHCCMRMARIQCVCQIPKPVFLCLGGLSFFIKRSTHVVSEVGSPPITGGIQAEGQGHCCSNPASESCAGLAGTPATGGSEMACHLFGAAPVS